MDKFEEIPKEVPQTGLIIKAPSPNDYIVGASPITGKIEERLVNGIWTPYRPINEVQFKKFSFDTMSCASFSANNVIEYQINWMLQNGKINPELKAWLNSKGYLENGVLNLSDRFTAIMSGTTKQGNFFQAVWDSIRKNGVIPEREFPFGGNTFEQYHDANLITPEMKALGLEWTTKFESFYEWITFDNNPDFTTDQIIACKAALKFAPLHIAIPVPGTHAITLEAIQEPNLTVFDHYPPFVNINQLNYQIHYAMRGYVALKAEAIIPVRTLKIGMAGEDVKILQTNLKTLGYELGTIDGKFGNITLAAVKAFQVAWKLVADGVVGKLTQATIANALKKKSELGKWKLLPELELKCLNFLRDCLFAGHNLFITQGFRTYAEQKALYDQGRTKPGPIVTNAKPGTSLHEFGKAFDIAFTGTIPYPNDDIKWKAVADIGKACGLSPGFYFTSFKDRPHFEIK